MGAIESARNLPAGSRLRCDVVVVGTGAGGSMAARELAARGAKVIALEEGSYVRQQQMTQREDEMMPRLYQERGGRSTSDLAIRVIGGRAVGGSTVHNINLCKRTPTPILELWQRRHHVSGCSEPELRPVFESVEAELSVTEIPEAMRNANNRVLERGVKALGWKGGPLSHNRVGCQQSGFCEIGCPFDAKQNAVKVLLPSALEHGARVISDARVTRIVHDGKRARGVKVAAPRGVLDIEAGAVVLAGSAVGSAVLARASALPDPHDRLGRGLRMHPGVAVAGLFDERIEGWKGIPQSYECTEHLDFSDGSERRIWIITAFAHPIGASIMLPGFGVAHHEWMRHYPNIAVLSAMIHDETEGRVGVRDDGRARIDYELIDGDVHQLALGMRACARLLFAAGAKRVLIPSVPAITLERPDQIESLPESAARPHHVGLVAVHPMGTLRMGDDARAAVVKSTGEHHQVERLFVLDGSLFPTSIGGPPQISIYSFSKHLSRHV
ncbi:MAG: GMC family oxidoreductase [Sorangiineae bacterium]|nr:GMC family oxidoreductase [Polyangiaceae bacterium]MEB2321642.1 GMC family oxidoreductase [Sorangiineae bacterium]